jgi:DNA excision repair protein ERCC-8
VHWYPFDTGLFVSGGSDGRVLVWDTNTADVVSSFNLGARHTGGGHGHVMAEGNVVHAARMSPCATTHSLVATGGGGGPGAAHVRLCDLNSGAFSHSLIGHAGAVLSVDWSPASEFLLASGGADGQLRVWDIRRAGSLLSLDQHNHTSAQLNQRYIDTQEAHARRDVAAHAGAAVHHVRWTPQGDRLVSAGTDRALRVWHMDAAGTRSCGRNALVHFEQARATQRINRFAISGDGRMLFSPQGSAVHEYHMDSGKLEAKLNAHLDRVACVAVHPAAAGCHVFSGGSDRSILVWSPRESGRLTAAQRAEEAEEQRHAAEEEREMMDREEREMHMRLLQQRQRRQQQQSQQLESSSRRAGSAARPVGVGTRNPDEDAWSSDED